MMYNTYVYKVRKGVGCIKALQSCEKKTEDITPTGQVTEALVGWYTKVLLKWQPMIISFSGLIVITK